jgi:hypothetical protein
MEVAMAEPRLDDTARNMEKQFQTASIDAYQTSIDLFKRGMDRSIDLQKQMLDTVSQQNTDTIELCRSMFSYFPAANPMFDFAEQAFDQFIEVQRMTLDIMGQQGGEVADSAKTQGERTARAVREVSDQRERKSA